MSRALPTRDKPNRVCTWCCGLIRSELEAKAAQKTLYFFVVDDDYFNRDCPTCRLLAEGLRHVEKDFKALKWEILVEDGLLFTTEDNGEKLTVEFYYTQCKPLTAISGWNFTSNRLLTGNSIIPDSIVFQPHVKAWWESARTLKYCQNIVHSDRLPKSGQKGPKRLLDLGDDFDADNLEKHVRLVELTNNAGAVPSYVTLSHTWGQMRPLSTNASNIEKHKVGITFDALSPTFKSAVVSTRRLGVRYLWIDSLCIIQGDDEESRKDWKEEGGKMHLIYANSVATIALHSAAEDGGKVPYRTIDFDRGEDKAEIHARLLPNRPDLLESIAEAPRGPTKTEIAPNSEWNEISLRGWCHQERALSRRVFHITDAELLVELDGQIVYCQCDHHHTEQTVGFAGWLTSDWDEGRGNPSVRPDRARYAWFELVEQYTQRMLSYESDLLPGMAGLANRMSNDCKMGEYAAGLWKENILQWLCWQSEAWSSANPGDVFCEDCRPHPRRVADTKVPSFSWASRFGPAEFLEEPWRTYDYFKPMAEISEVKCQVDAQNPYGIVTGGYIDFKTATLYPVLHFSTVGWELTDFVHSSVGCQKHYACLVDTGFSNRLNMDRSSKEIFEDARHCGIRYTVDATDDIPPNESVVYLLEVFHSSVVEKSIMLVVAPHSSGVQHRQSSNDEGKDQEQVEAFRRIGICVMSTTSFLEPPRPRYNIKVRLM